VCGYVQALKPFELSGLNQWFFRSLYWNPEVPTPLISVKALSTWLLPSLHQRNVSSICWSETEDQWSVRATSNALQRKFHANPFFYNSKLWLFVAVSTNLYLYSWKACLLLAVLVIVHFSQGAEANFHKLVRPIPAEHSVSLDSCFSLLEFLPKTSFSSQLFTLSSKPPG